LFFIVGVNQPLVSPVGVLAHICAAFHHILGAQLFLRRQCLFYSGKSESTFAITMEIGV
jgi:hypothetical protein